MNQLKPTDLSVAGSCSNHAERQRSEPDTPKARVHVAHYPGLSPRAQRAVTGPSGQSLDPAVLRNLAQGNGVLRPQQPQTEAVSTRHPFIRRVLGSVEDLVHTTIVNPEPPGGWSR